MTASWGLKHFNSPQNSISSHESTQARAFGSLSRLVGTLALLTSILNHLSPWPLCRVKYMLPIWVESDFKSESHGMLHFASRVIPTVQIGVQINPDPMLFLLTGQYKSSLTHWFIMDLENCAWPNGIFRKEISTIWAPSELLANSAFSFHSWLSHFKAQFAL